MEIKIEIKYDPFEESEGKKRDKIIRAIDRELGKKSIWKKNGKGWIVST